MWFHRLRISIGCWCCRIWWWWSNSNFLSIQQKLVVSFFALLSCFTENVEKAPAELRVSHTVESMPLFNKVFFYIIIAIARAKSSSGPPSGTMWNRKKIIWESENNFKLQTSSFSLIQFHWNLSSLALFPHHRQRVQSWHWSARVWGLIKKISVEFLRCGIHK